jgi:penicillin-insensitive murein endopeptidase
MGLGHMLGALAISACVVGCMGSPTPLAPNLGGTVGVPHSGVLTNGVELPARGPGFVRYRPKGDHYWGHPDLVAAVEAAAARVAEQRPGGAPLVVGDFSAKTGGKIPGHHSHRTGRDVDLLYFAMTPSGASVRSPGFVRFGSDGLAQVEGLGYLRVDLEREWLLIKELLLSPRIEVEWLFASRDMEALIVDYARARGEDPMLVWRAESMLLQPGDSSAHDDHIHMRIACSAEDELRGCMGGGPRWPWLDPAAELPELDDGALSTIAKDDPPELLPSPSEDSRAGGDV